MSEPSLIGIDNIKSLIGPEVGTWVYDIANDRCFGCRIYANLLGLTYGETTIGVPIERIAGRIHPDDRAQARARRLHLVEHGGLFVQEFRTTPQVDGDYRWLLSIGQYVKNMSGQATSGRGIIFDTSRARSASDTTKLMLAPLSSADREQGVPIDRAIAHSIKVHEQIELLPAAERAVLMPLIDALLMQLGMIISAKLRESENQEQQRFH